MTCTTAFYVAVSQGVSITSENYVTLSGSVTVPAVYTPSWQCCLPIFTCSTWTPAHCSGGWAWYKGQPGGCTHHWQGICDEWAWIPPYYGCNNWQKGSGTNCSWSTECITIEGAEIFPEFVLSSTANVHFTSSASVDIIFTVDLEYPIPYYVISLTITSATITLSLNIVGFPSYIGTFIIASELIVQNANGQFSVIVPLDTIGGTVEGTDELLTWEATLELQFCLTPENGLGWMNLVVNFTMGYGEITITSGVEAQASISAAYACPIIEASPDPPPP